MLKAIGDLKGKKVLDAFIESGVPVITFTDGSSISAWQDEEQNGPGSLRWCGKRNDNALLVPDDNPYIHNSHPVCKKCGSELRASGKCSDQTCPYSDRKQSETYTEG